MILQSMVMMENKSGVHKLLKVPTYTKKKKENNHGFF